MSWTLRWLWSRSSVSDTSPTEDWPPGPAHSQCFPQERQIQAEGPAPPGTPTLLLH